MEMRLFIVDNNFLSILRFIEAIKERRWTYYDFTLPKGVADDESIRQFLGQVCRERPDIVVLDAALTSQEEKLLDDSGLEKEVSSDYLSGFKYCRALASERLGIPIVILTNYAHGPVARMAMRAGADRVLIKRDSQNEILMREIEELVKSKTPHDPAFYWPMKDDFDTDLGLWQVDPLRKALNRFFLNASSVRRFGLFTASLRDILSLFFQGDVDCEKKLMRGLVKSQVLLSLVDPALRDHVRHTGNVFWVGYQLLHKLEEFLEPTLLRGCLAALYDTSGPLNPREQLLYTWTLAALFHDFGYVDERQEQLARLLSDLLPNDTIEHRDVRGEPTWNRNMTLLRNFVSTLAGPNCSLFHFLDSVITSFGSEMECTNGCAKKTAKLLDHGFLSAHRLLDMIPLGRLDSQKRNIVLHAALAIACHNRVEMLHKWKFDNKCRGQLSIGMFPVCSLLAFCDCVQTWDREPEFDPAITRTEAYDGLLERLVLSDTAFISGSEIREFSLVRRQDNSGSDLLIKLRYFVEVAGGVEEVCDSLGHDIQRWIDRNRLTDVCDMMGLSPILHGQIVYELPMLAGTRKVTF
jgi:DNA-binding NarL/FixJ family response regulator